MEKAKPHSRRADVLKLLAEHGPMSGRAIMQCVRPPMNRRRLSEVIGRLKKYGWVSCKNQYGSLGDPLYYFLAHKTFARHAVARHIGIDPAYIRPPFFRRIDLIHSDHCALWKEYFKRKFPDALILRDHEFHYLDVGNRLLMSHREDNDLNPDMLLVFRRPEFSRPASIAVEIERNIKGPTRLARKLCKYAAETYLDGVIYFCEADVRPNLIHTSYRDNVLKDINRVSHFGHNFVLFSNSEFQGFDRQPEMFNSFGKAVCLGEWMSTLLRTEEYQRDESMFAVPMTLS